MGLFQVIAYHLCWVTLPSTQPTTDYLCWVTFPSTQPTTDYLCWVMFPSTQPTTDYLCWVTLPSTQPTTLILLLDSRLLITCIAISLTTGGTTALPNCL